MKIDDEMVGAASEAFMLDAAMSHGACEECKYWDCAVSHRDNANTGLCRINPPVADKRTSLAVWPFTEPEDWCSRFLKEASR